MGCSSSVANYKKEIISQTPIQFYLDEVELGRFIKNLKIVRCKRETILFNEGDLSETFFIVAQGKVQIKKYSGKTGHLLASKLSGDCFGSSALRVEDAIRTTFAIADAGSELFTLSKKDFLNMAKKRDMESVVQKVTDMFRTRLSVLLHEIPFLSELADDHVRVLSEMFEYVTVPAGFIILEEGDLSQEMYVILEGSVEASTIGIDGKSIVLDTLERGQYFAEIALMLHTPRSATCTAIKKSLLLKLTRESYDIFLEQNPKFKDLFTKVAAERLSKIIKKFRIPFFDLIPEGQFLQFGHVVEVITREPGEIIFNEGDDADEFYIISHGELQVSCNGEDLKILTDGDYFGEIALVIDTKRTATIKAITHSTLLRVNERDFTRFFQKDLVVYSCVVLRISQKDAPLSAVLEHPLGRKLFRKIIKSEFAEENLEFWERAHQFKEEASDDMNSLLDEAKSIVKMYIINGADSQVNISYDQQQYIIKEIMEKKTVGRDIFDIVEMEVLGMMEGGVFGRFKNTDDFQVLLDEVGCYSTVYGQEMKVKLPSPSNTIVETKTQH